ncbi:MAG: hypothetical protein O3C43_22955 [Verrucomicrobia bacterium]|nr:hypothetical protein [Verrucomicrobiota bacterium]MDA1069348.1 hypothetical protein [Verrucomicrobiota bacterium]
MEYAGPLATDGTNLFVNTSTGVVRTTDGTSFLQTADIENSTWQFVKVVNGEVWVGDGISSQHYTYLWRSSDLGATWNAASNGMPGDVNLITVDDVTYDEDTGTYWTASQFGGAYRSADGTNWTQHRVGLPQVPFVGYSVGKYIVAEGGDAMLSMNGDGNIVGAGIFRTQNNGASWSKLPEVVAGTPGNFIQIGDRILYTSSGINLITGGLFITEDFGDTWTYQDQWLKTAFSMATDGTTVFAGKGAGVWYSANQGDSWDRIDTTGLPQGWNVVAIEKVGNNLFLLSEENNVGKLYRLDVSGVQFRASTQITLQPVGDDILEGNAITLESDAIGEGTITYQWFRDGALLPGKTSKDLVIDPAELTDAGAYTVKATGGFGIAESNPATVVIKNRNIGAPDPQFSISAGIFGDVEASVIDPDGNVWFTGQFSVANNSIIKVDPVEGTILASMGSSAQGKSAALDSEGKIWIGTNNAWLHRISPTAATIDFTVDINVNAGSGRVNEIIPYGDEGKVLIAGLFNKVGGVDTGPMVLLNHDGTIDTSFDFSLSMLSTTEIRGMDVDGDGNIYVISGSSVRPVYKLNPDGSNQTDWWPGEKMEPQNQANIKGDLRDIKVMLDGTILLGFRNHISTNTVVIPTPQNIMHIAADSSWINDFNVGGTGAAGEVHGIHIAPDGKIIIRGNFNGYVGATYNSGNKNITRLNADGSPDPYWNPGQEGWRGTVMTASIDADGNVFGGTDHTWYNGTNLSRILKLAGDVSPVAIVAQPQPLTILDLGETATFKVYAFGTTALAYQWRKDGVNIPGANADILELTNIDDADDGYYDVKVSNSSGTLFSEEARLMTISVPKYVIQPMAISGESGDELMLSVEAIGLGDLTYQWYFEGEAIAGATDASYTIPFAAVSNSGSYYVEVTGTSGTSTSESALVVVESFAGALDLGFKKGTGFNGQVYDMKELEDGSVIAGGYFTQYNGVTVPNIAKLDSNGVLDETWTSIVASNTWVRTMDFQADGKLLLGGPFNKANGWSWAISRLKTDGTFDTDFNSAGTGFNNNSAVLQLAVQEDGKILILVDRTYNTNPIYNDVPVDNLFRINEDGSIDDTFAMVETSNTPLGFKLLRSGKIILYGSFTTVNGESISRILRLNANGAIDDTFALGASPNSQVVSVDETGDRKLVLSGNFQTLGGYSRQFLALLNADGSVNEEFDTSPTSGNYPSGATYDAKALLNGDILVIGNFLVWGSQPQAPPYRIATVNRQGEKTGFVNDSHPGFSSNPASGKLFPGAGYCYFPGMNLFYHNQSMNGLGRIHLDAMDLVFLEQPEDQYVEAGQTATFTADVLGTTTVGYQWYKDSVAVPGGNSETLEITNVQENDVGIYTLEVVNASGSTVSVPVILYILAEPEVVNDPLGKVANSGSTVNLVAEGIGAAPLTLQWYHDDVAINGATDETLVLSGVLVEDAGMYHAVYTNNLGSISTRKVALSVQYGAAGVDPGFTPSYFGSPGISFVGKTPDNGYRIAGGFTQSGGLFTYYTGIDNSGTVIQGLFLQNNTGVFFGNAGFQWGQFNSEGIFVGMNGANIFRVLSNGKTDDNFDASGVIFPNFTSPFVRHMDDGTIFLTDNNYLVKLNSDGSVDETFNDGGTGPVGQVSGIAVGANEKIFIYGTFTSYNGTDVNGMALLNADGTLDSSFSTISGVSGSEYTLPVSMAHIASDGKIYIGGNFTTFDGSPVQLLFRIESNGMLDTGFTPLAFGNSFSQVKGMLELADGTLLVRGQFSQYGGVNQGYVVALDTTGARIDGMVGLGYNGPISDWVLESNGSITMVGSFFSPKNRMMRINPVPPTFEIVAQPEAFTIDNGQYGRLEVAVVGQGPLTFQWKKDGVAIDGETRFFIEFDPAELADRGSYSVDVTSGGTVLTSDTVAPAIEGTEPTAYDLWAIAQGIPEGKRKTTDDPDGDGIPNAVEYAFGTNPLVADQVGAPEPEFLTGTELGLGNNDIYLTLTVRVKRDVPGVTVTPRASVSLLSLNAGASNVVVMSGPVADGDYDIFQYRSAFSVNAGSPQGFMDVLVLTF